MTTWSDIQRLAADLQRVQLAEGIKRLSDANCVEVVSMLMSMGLVDLVVTTDGKEYVTRKHLVTECASECMAAGGRLALTELAAQLNVDLDHVQTAVNCLLRRQQADESPEFAVCAGELIHCDYLNDICARLDARLRETGHLSMLNLTRQWELSTEMVNQHILPAIGNEPGARISAIRFEDQLCTPRYISSLQSKLTALLLALTKPTALATIHSELSIGQTLFFKLWADLSDGGHMPGKLVGTKNSLKSLYVPDIHERLAKQYIRQKMSDEHYIECIVLKRLMVAAEPSAFFRELLPSKEFQDLLFWPSVVLSESKLWRECDSLAKNLIQSNHFYLLEDILPTQFTFLTKEDNTKVVERLQQSENGSNLRATEDREVMFEQPQLVDSWLKMLDAYIRERAQKDAPELRKAQLNAALAKKEGQKASPKDGSKNDWELDKPGKKGKGGAKKGAAAGRSGKRGETAESSQMDPLSLAQLSAADLFAELARLLPPATGLPDSLCAELEDELLAGANKLYRGCVAGVWQQANSGEQQEQRRIYEQKLAKVADAYAAICLHERAAETFDDTLAEDLRAYLLRSLCTEMAQQLLHTLADPTAQNAPPNFSAKLRDQLVAGLESKEMQKAAKELFDALDTMEHFHDAAQRLASVGGLMLRQPDKKERSERLASIGRELRAQMTNCVDPPTVLLLTVLFSLQRLHGVAVHASGKFVSPLIAFISANPSAEAKPFHAELCELLGDTQRLVVTSIKLRGGDADLESELTDKVQKMKALFRTEEESDVSGK